MKGLKLMLFTVIAMLMGAFAFSQNSQVKPIQLDEREGVFITIDLMDNISLKLIDREILKKENTTLTQTLENVQLQNKELDEKFILCMSQAEKFKDLYKITEIQKNELFEVYGHQKQIISNVKKNPLRTDYCILGEVFRSESLSLQYS